MKALFLLQIESILSYSFHLSNYDKILPRSMELSYQEGFINTLMNQFKESSTPVLDESSDYYILLKPIIDRLIDACIYFSPECEDYMKHLKILLVDSDELNAYTTMGISLTEMAHSLGSIIVINTGLIHHFEKLKKDGQNINIEEVGANNRGSL